jgi:hypothetical protein
MAALSDHEQYLLTARNLTAAQLRLALEIVQSELGRKPEAADGALVGAVLVTLGENYRHKTK